MKTIFSSTLKKLSMYNAGIVVVKIEAVGFAPGLKFCVVLYTGMQKVAKTDLGSL
jgi:hypothetical protein